MAGPLHSYSLIPEKIRDPVGFCDCGRDLTSALGASEGDG